MTLKIENLNKNFNNLTVFNDFNISFKNNSITCILGPSGCGKTTLLNIISGLVEPDSGCLTGFSSDSISYIFQEPRLLKWMNVWENINFILKDVHSKEDRNIIIEEHLKMVDLYDFKDYLPDKLSGGMKQRVSIARAFAYPSKLLIMDEPFKGLDSKLKTSLIDSFNRLWEKDKRTVIFVTHDIDEAILLGDEIYLFSSTPAQIKKHLVLNIPKEKRRITDLEIIKIRENLL